MVKVPKKMERVHIPISPTNHVIFYDLIYIRLDTGSLEQQNANPKNVCILFSGCKHVHMLQDLHVILKEPV